MSRRTTVAPKVAALADGTRTIGEIARELGVSREYVSATLGRLDLRDKVRRAYSGGPSIKTVAKRRLDLLRRAHAAMDSIVPFSDDWDALVADMKKELGL